MVLSNSMSAQVCTVPLNSIPAYTYKVRPKNLFAYERMDLSNNMSTYACVVITNRTPTYELMVLPNS